MKSLKKIVMLVLTILTIGTIIPAQNVEAAKSKKLTKKDFVWKRNGEKQDFIKETEGSEYYIQIFWKDSDPNAPKSNTEYEFKRKIGLGSSAKSIIKKYGKTAKKKIKKTDRIYETVYYGYPQVDVATWKTYYQYKYKNGKDQYVIRFFMNKKNKVMGIVLVKNPKKFLNYANKEVKSGIRFEAPKGKKIVTQKIYGKKVYILPKGTKIYAKEQDEVLQDIRIYDMEHNKIAGVWGDFIKIPNKGMEIVKRRI